MTFKTLEIEDKDKIYPFFDNNTFDLCVYSPKSILVWRARYYRPEYKITDSSLFIGAHFDKDIKENHLILPQTDNEEILSPQYLHSLIKSSKFNYFKYVPQCYIDKFTEDEVNKYFEIHEMTADSDYVYTRESLSGLKGRKLSKKRNLVNQFLKQYDGRYSFTTIHEQNREAVLDFLEEWCIKRDCEKDPESDIYCEKKAAENAINYSEFLEYKSLVLKVDDEIKGIALSSNITAQMGGLHFQKAAFEIKGLYQFFDKNCAEKLFDENTLFINKESDMDDEGLRKAKKSYYPERLITSYELIPK